MGKRLIKTVACKRNALFFPLSFTCLWLGMFSCTWGTQGIFQRTRNLCQRGWADFRNADLLMCFLHIKYWWTLKHSFLGLYFSRSEANLLQVMSTLSKLEIRTMESTHIGLKLCQSHVSQNTISSKRSNSPPDYSYTHIPSRYCGVWRQIKVQNNNTFVKLIPLPHIDVKPFT